MDRISLHRIYKTAVAPLLCLLFASVLAIPAGGADSEGIVSPKQVYTYEMLERDIRALAEAYPELIRYESIGQSEYGRELWKLEVGNGPAAVLLNGAHHAREWITTALLMETAEHLARSASRGAEWKRVNSGDLLDHVTFHIVPMVNPDGVTLQQKGASAFPKEVRASLVEMNDGSDDFKRWKANAKGIDLNRQYPAGWETIRDPAPDAPANGPDTTSPADAPSSATEPLS